MEPKKKALFFTQFFGVLNDNLLKGAICFIAINWVPLSQQASILALSSVLLVVPYLLLSPLAGNWSERYSKIRVVQWAKLAEIPIMAIAILGFWLQSISLSLLAIFLMGTQSAIYSPSKYGLIRDVYGESKLASATGIMEMLSFVAILVGTVLGAFVAELTIIQTALLASAFMSLAMLGWRASLQIEAVEPKKSESTHSVSPIRFFRQGFRTAKKTKGLLWAISGLGCFWLLGCMLQLTIELHCSQVLGLTESVCGGIMALAAIGIGFGSFSAGKIAARTGGQGLSAVGAIGMFLSLIFMYIFSDSALGLATTAFSAAFFSGWYKIPLNTWLQQKVKGRKLGQVLAFSNMVVYLFVLLGAGLFNMLASFDTGFIFVFFVLYGAVVAGFAIARNPRYLLQMVLRAVVHFTYRIKIEGAENLPKSGGALVVANHASYLDFALMSTAIPRRVRFVMSSAIYNNKWLRPIMKKLNMIPIGRTNEGASLKAFNENCQQEINDGHVVCIFPEGTVTRTGTLLEYKRGVEHIAEGIQSPIIPVHFQGIAGTPFSFHVGRKKFVLPTLSTLRKKVIVTIGAQQERTTSAFELMQLTKELEHSSFSTLQNDTARLDSELAGILSTQNAKLRAIEFGKIATTKGEIARQAFRWARFWKKQFPNTAQIALQLHNSPQRMAATAGAILAGKNLIFLPKKMSNDGLFAALKQSKAQLCIAEKRMAMPCEIEHFDFAELLTDFTAKDPRKSYKPAKTQSTFTFFENNADKVPVPVQTDSKTMLAMIKTLLEIHPTQPTDLAMTNFENSTLLGVLHNMLLPLFCIAKFRLQPKPLSAVDFTSEILANEPNIVVLDQHECDALGTIAADLNFVNRAYISSKSDAELLAKKGVQQILPVLATKSLGVLASNCPDYVGPDIAGQPLVQQCADTATMGRPMPGVALKIVDENDHKKQLGPGEIGTLLVRAVVPSQDQLNRLYGQYQDWIVLPYKACIDRRGFLKLA